MIEFLVGIECGNTFSSVLVAISVFTNSTPNRYFTKQIFDKLHSVFSMAASALGVYNIV